MDRLTLARNVNFLYEDYIARLELKAFGCTEYQRDDEQDWTEVATHVNGQAQAIHERSAYVGWLGNRATVYQQLIQPRYQGGAFNRTRSVNQYLTHWIYPYRGKFHPQMVRAVLNILKVQPGTLLWEPFVGSGTAALESSLLGIHSIGTDLSPLCVMLTRVKTRSWKVAPAIRDRVESLLGESKLHPDRVRSKRTDDERVTEFVEIARMVTYSDAARRSRDAAEWFRKNLKAMLESVEAHAAAVDRFGLTPGRVDARLGDARDAAAAGLQPASIGCVVTSPPYSIALDYVKNDEHALDAIGVDSKQLRSTMTGVRGRGPREKMALYNADMQRVFQQVAWALKPGAPAAFVIGDATVDGREITTVETMARWAEAAGLVRERSIKKIVFGLYNVMDDERILVFRKP